MDIRGLSYARIQQLVDAGLVDDAADLFALRADQLAPLEGFAEKQAANLVAAIGRAKAQPLSRLLFGLGILHVGSTVAQVLARHFGTLDALLAAGEAEIGAVHGVGPIIARAVAQYIEDPSARRLIDKLRRAGVNFSEPTSVASHGALRGLAVVITGTLPTLSRARATALIDAAGGRVTSAVSKTTSLLVAGAEPGSKLERAQALGTEVIDEAELLRRVGAAATSS